MKQARGHDGVTVRAFGAVMPVFNSVPANKIIKQSTERDYEPRKNHNAKFGRRLCTFLENAIFANA